MLGMIKRTNLDALAVECQTMSSRDTRENVSHALILLYCCVLIKSKEPNEGLLH